MKNRLMNLAELKSAFMICVIFLLSAPVFSQSDTLHLNYHHTQILPHDSTQKKIDAWVKKLNGQHVDIEVNAYYHKAEFKKFSQQRADELFLVLNRKARSLITIKSIGPKKGEDYQRTMVDVIYTKALTEAEKAEKLAAEKKEKERIAAEKEAKNAEKAAEKKAKEKELADKKANEKSEVPEGKPKKDNKGGAPDLAEKTKGNKEGKSDKAEPEDEDEKEEAIASKSSRYPARRFAFKVGINEEELAFVKNAKIIVTSTHSNHNDNLLLDAMREYWTFNPNISVMPYDSASILAKKDKTLLLVFITRIITKDMTKHKQTIGVGPVALSRTTQDAAVADAVVLERGKKKMVFTSFFPRVYNGEKSTITPEFVNFAVSVMNSTFKSMDEQGMTKIRRMNAPFAKYAPELKNRTLLIASTMLSTKMPPSEVGNYYQGKFEVVDYKTYQDAIITKKPYAYVVPVPISMGGDIRWYDYILDSQTGQVYYIHQPGIITAPKIRGPLGNRHALTHSERISSKNLEKYNKAFEVKDDKDDEEEIKVDENKGAEVEGAESGKTSDSEKKEEKPKGKTKDAPKKESKDSKKSKSDKKEESSENTEKKAE